MGIPWEGGGREELLFLSKLPLNGGLQQRCSERGMLWTPGIMLGFSMPVAARMMRAAVEGQDDYPFVKMHLRRAI
eukprot:scaffold210096_cov21-Tisochrysis_lutea.AAC.1